MIRSGRILHQEKDAADPEKGESSIVSEMQEPVQSYSNHGFSARELTTIRNEVRANLLKIIEAWHEHCD